MNLLHKTIYFQIFNVKNHRDYLWFSIFRKMIDFLCYFVKIMVISPWAYARNADKPWRVSLMRRQRSNEIWSANVLSAATKNVSLHRLWVAEENAEFWVTSLTHDPWRIAFRLCFLLCRDGVLKQSVVRFAYWRSGQDQVPKPTEYWPHAPRWRAIFGKWFSSAGFVLFRLGPIERLGFYFV